MLKLLPDNGFPKFYVFFLIFFFRNHFTSSIKLVLLLGHQRTIVIGGVVTVIKFFFFGQWKFNFVLEHKIANNTWFWLFFGLSLILEIFHIEIEIKIWSHLRHVLAPYHYFDTVSKSHFRQNQGFLRTWKIAKKIMKPIYFFLKTFILKGCQNK